jgi:hypothetical protein
VPIGPAWSAYCSKLRRSLDLRWNQACLASGVREGMPPKFRGVHETEVGGICGSLSEGRPPEKSRNFIVAGGSPVGSGRAS